MKNPRLLRHLVTIQELVAGSPPQTPSGEDASVWTDVATGVYAEWETLRGSALFAAQQQHADVRGVWRIRWRDGITADMRIVHRGLYYNIVFVPPYDKTGRRLEMELECEQGVSNG